MNQRSNAFTLIELLIVVAIIGILAAIAVPNFLNAQIRAKIGRVQSEFTTIRTAFEMYRMDGNGRLPDAWVIGGWYVAWQRITTPVAYLPSVPIDIFQPKEKMNFVNEHNFYESVEANRTASGTQKDFAIACRHRPKPPRGCFIAPSSRSAATATSASHRRSPNSRKR